MASLFFRRAKGSVYAWLLPLQFDQVGLGVHRLCWLYSRSRPRYRTACRSRSDAGGRVPCYNDIHKLIITHSRMTAPDYSVGTGWDRVGYHSPWLHGEAYKTLLSSCRGVSSGKECWLGSERVYDNRECWLLHPRNEWWWLRSRICLLILKGSVLESELGQRWWYGVWC